MRKWIIALVVVLALVGGGLAFALSNLNSYLNQNRDWLAAQVEAELGRKVSFGEIGVSLAGGLSARVTKLRVADDPAFAKEDFVVADDVQVAVKIIPALFGRFEVRRILLDAPAVTIIKTADAFNFDSIGKKPGSKGEAEPTAKAAAPAAGSSSGDAPPAGAAAAFIVSRTEIRDGQLRYLDRSRKPASDLIIRQLDFAASDLSLTSPMEIEVSAALFGAEKQNVELAGRLGPLGSPPNPQKAPLDLELALGPVVIDEMKKLPALAAALPPELSSADPVEVKVAVKGDAQNPTVALQFDVKSAAIRYGSSFVKPKGTPMKLELAAARSGNTLDVKSLAFQLAGLELTGKGQVVTGEPGTVDFQIDSKRAPLEGWDELLPALAGHDVSGEFEMHLRARGPTGGGRAPALDGSLVLDRMNARMKDSPHQIEGLSTRIDFKGDSATIPPTKFKLGGSPVELEAKVESIEKRAVDFSLRSPELRAASLGVAGEGAKKEEVIRGLDLRGAFTMASGAPQFRGTMRSSAGSLRDVDYQELDSQFGLREQVATLEKLKLRAFEGSYDGGGRYDMREPEDPRFDFRSTIRAMDLRALLATKLPGAEQKIEGRLDADLELEGSGKGWETIRERLRGDGRVDVKDGVLKDVNIADQVLTSVTGIGGLANLVSPRTRAKYPELFATGDTRFEKLGGSVVIADGRATSDDLTLAARDYTILGRGTFELDNHLDSTATLVASRQLTEDVIDDVKEAKYIANDQGRLEIPFRLTGSLPSVRPKPDSEFIVRALGRAAIGTGIEKGLDKLLGGKKQRDAAPQAGAPPEKTPRPEEDLLRRGLEGIFGK